jgi:hypothetical protein
MALVRSIGWLPIGNPATRRRYTLGPEALRHHLSMALPKILLLKARRVNPLTLPG